MIETDTLIIGGGLAGLSAAHALEGKRAYLLCEREPRLGGLAASVKKNGFTFDYSGHLLHLRWPKTKKFILNLLDGNHALIERKARIFSNGVYTPYPFQANLSGLPATVRSECVRGFLAAYKKSHRPYAIGHTRKSPEVFTAWTRRVFGEGISKHFMLPYNSKLWRYPLEKLSTEWCAPFVPRPTLKQVLEGAYQRGKEAIGYNASFYYPLRGGIQALPDAFARGLTCIERNCAVTAIDLKNKTAICGCLGPVKFKHLINTAALNDFIAKLTAPPSAIKQAAKKLGHNTVYVLNLGVKNAGCGIHWAYFPERNFPFYRAGIASNFSKRLAPKGLASFYIEVSTPDAPLNLSGAETAVIKGLISCALIKKESDIIESLWLKIPCAYVIYNRERAASLPVIFDWLTTLRAQSIGRYGSWKYSFMEESVKEGLEAAEKVLRHG
ncbi:MAG: hypothetical protein A2X34_03060 [Elusimicrobia bacterium GWC2_51_8]|nr:MAG: hypothetical protein A2X33_09350 [Elusimicrobia bacterium GWA2_51_34]OGR60587.1 MAG: hypothetical protein A2X34_03060 [Elusimicrobia bacterium GWC2_51_8]OGR88355.1 MAG: hypothetical protein A2021_01910 [Elusimicrobia bacterium GWF2_52_66]